LNELARGRTAEVTNASPRGPERLPVPEADDPTWTAFRNHWAVAVADVGWFTTDHLFREAAALGIPALLLTCLDWRNALNRGYSPRRFLTSPVGWGRGEQTRADGPDGPWRRELILPPGWMKRFPTLGMRPIAWTIGAWKRRIAPQRRLALVITYPHYLILRDALGSLVAGLVYYGVDDYRLYWPGAAAALEGLERRAVAESDLVAGASAALAERLAGYSPSEADRGRVIHLPHGHPSRWGQGEASAGAAVPKALAGLPRPWIGLVGTLGDRVDWPLLERLADEFAGGSLILVGRIDDDHASAPWRVARRRLLARSNVHPLGWQEQSEVAALNAAFDVGLIPYRLDDPFNQACCPTKLLDGLGSGRPLVATALPECQRHAGLIGLARDAEEFIAEVRRALEEDSPKARAARLERAADWSCRRQLLRLLGALAKQVEANRPTLADDRLAG